MDTLDILIQKAKTTKERLLYTALKFFSLEGYSNVGIRQICKSVGIKESSFYNHFKSKESLFREIMELMVKNGDEILVNDEYIDLIVKEKTLEEFMIENLQRIKETFTNPLFMAIIRLVVMESFINPLAYELSEKNNYSIVRLTTIKILEKYQENGSVKKCNIPSVVDAYYHGIKTYNDTYILNDAWGKKQDEVIEGLNSYNLFYIKLLKGDFYEN